MTFIIRRSGLQAAAVFMCACLALSASAQADWRQAEALVEATSQSMQTLIDQAKAYVDEDPEKFYQEVEALLEPVVDFPRFAGSVMGKKYYEMSTAEQRQRFADSFKWGLVRTYGLALTEFEDGKLVLVPATTPPQRPDRISVNQEIHTATGQIYPVVYSMAFTDAEGWRMRNIIVNGVNMGLTYRNQFASAAQKPEYGGDLDKIIDAWAGLLEQEAKAVAEQTQANVDSAAQ